MLFCSPHFMEFYRQLIFLFFDVATHFSPITRGSIFSLRSQSEKSVLHQQEDSNGKSVGQNHCATFLIVRKVQKVLVIDKTSEYLIYMTCFLSTPSFIALARR